MNHHKCFIVLWVALAVMGCKDDHHGHDHDAEGHAAHEGHAHVETPDAPSSKQGSDEHAEHADEVTLTPEAIKRWAIRTEPLSRHVLTEMLLVPARVSFNGEAIAHVGTVVSGRIDQMQVRVGDSVKPGDALLGIASPELGRAQSDYLHKRSAIATAEASVKVSQSIYAGAKALHDESRGIALSEVQKREAELRVAEGALVAARSEVTSAENTLHVLGMDQKAIDALSETGEIHSHHVIRSPIEGQVIEREVTLGEIVGPERDALMVLADLRTLWVIADVPEIRIGDVRVGSQASVSVPAFRDHVFKGTVAYLGAQLNPATRTIPARIEVTGSDAMLRPGMFARVELVVGDVAGEPVAAIPEAAVQHVEGESCVFVPVADEPNTFAKRVVRIGAPIGRMVPVLGGLQEGEPYVVHGSFMLKADLGKAGAAHEH